MSLEGARFRRSFNHTSRRRGDLSFFLSLSMLFGSWYGSREGQNNVRYAHPFRVEISCVGFQVCLGREAPSTIIFLAKDTPRLSFIHLGDSGLVGIMRSLFQYLKFIERKSYGAERTCNNSAKPSMFVGVDAVRGVVSTATSVTPCILLRCCHGLDNEIQR